ncbi:MAG: tetratricopeptide repeat protein [Bacteroidia bacterium]|nr:MAG: tetratricopeptide repeat protein [Bacteroidia bacterium]
MAKSKKKENLKGLENVEETLTRTEQFLENNYRPMLYILAVIVVVVGGVWVGKLRMNSKGKEAVSQMYVAEDYFAKDSFNLALYGDGNYLGFIDIADEYKSTKPGNLANYYAGVSFLNMGEFENAIDYLEKFKKKDKVLSPVALGCIGDAWVELGDTKKGVEFYNRAASFTENDFYSPIYLMKAGQLHELSGDWVEALAKYETIKKKYPDSNEGNNIDKYIARANNMK